MTRKRWFRWQNRGTLESFKIKKGSRVVDSTGQQGTAQSMLLFYSKVLWDGSSEPVKVKTEDLMSVEELMCN